MQNPSSYTLLSLLAASSRIDKQRSTGVRTSTRTSLPQQDGSMSTAITSITKDNILGQWIHNQRNKKMFSLLPFEIFPFTETIESNCQIDQDENGLRGLKWSDITNDPAHSAGDNSGSGVACRLPMNCAIVDRNEASLMRKVFSIICEEEEAKQCGVIKGQTQSGREKDYQHHHYSPYLNSLPSPGDFALQTPATKWTESQLGRLDHSPTIAYFRKLHQGREEAIHTMLEGTSSKEIFNRNLDRILAGWTYDLVTSRSLTGNFGQQGNLRTAVSMYITSFFLWALMPFTMMSHNSAFLLTSSSLSSLLGDYGSITFLLTTLPPILSSFAMAAYVIFGCDIEVAMLPWIDLANHKSGGERMMFEYDLLLDSVVWKKQSGEKEDSRASLNILNTGAASSSTSSSSWITFDYGGKQGMTNDQLLGVFGFVEIDNPNDTLQLELRGNDTSTSSTTPTTPMAITIGRQGKLVHSPSINNKPSFSFLRSAAAVATDARAQMLRREKDDKNADVNKDDPIDAARAALAKTWREEKIRLLDEFLEQSRHQVRYS